MDSWWLAVVIGLALTFDLTNGFHDSSNSLAAPVATRAMTPGQALAVTTAFTVLGPIVAGTAVADTVGGLVEIDADDVLPILAAALLAAVGWNLLTWWRGLPSSSSHALVGGLVGAGVATAGVGAVNWGGFDGWRPVGVLGVLVALAASPLIGGVAGWAVDASARRALRRADRRVTGPLKSGQWVTSAALAFAHGTNDAQKTMGLITLALVAAGSLPAFVVPTWVKVVCAVAMTLGTALGGWRIVRTVGRGIYRIRPLDGLASQGASSLVIGGAAAVGAPVSTTHVVASSVVGVGTARRWRHVRWRVVREILLAWVVTLPGCAAWGAAIAWVEGLWVRMHWFMPETPDVLGTLRAQADVTVRGLVAFAAWARGAADQGQVVRAAEHEADTVRRTLQAQLRRAFSTPIDQEDLYSLSELLDGVLNAAKNIVREAEVLAIDPDERSAELADELHEGVTHVRAAFDRLTGTVDVATAEADAALAAERRMEKVYRRAMHDLLSEQDLRQVVARRELYRRLLEAGERLAAVAERIWYAVVKEG